MNLYLFFKLYLISVGCTDLVIVGGIILTGRVGEPNPCRRFDVQDIGNLECESTDAHMGLIFSVSPSDQLRFYRLLYVSVCSCAYVCVSSA